MKIDTPMYPSPPFIIGMSVREFYAGLAFDAIIRVHGFAHPPEDIAKQIVSYVDRLIDELEKPHG